ncbi:hypothetical protein GGU10DRAFT_274763, partial [Lentinula aff. detonsa]
KVNVWGCITPWGVGELLRINGSLNAEQLVELYHKGLLCTLNMYAVPHHCILFQQDNDPKHTS